MLMPVWRSRSHPEVCCTSTHRSFNTDQLMWNTYCYLTVTRTWSQLLWVISEVTLLLDNCLLLALDFCFWICFRWFWDLIRIRSLNSSKQISYLTKLQFWVIMSPSNRMCFRQCSSTLHLKRKRLTKSNHLGRKSADNDWCLIDRSTFSLYTI